MNAPPQSSVDTELRLPHEPVLAGVLVFAISLVLLDPPVRPGRDTSTFAFLLYAAVAAVWLVGRWRPATVAWLTLALLAATELLTRFWFGWQGLLSLLIIPTALAGAIITPQAAAVLAVAESVVVAAWLTSGLPSSEGTMALVAIWSGAGLVTALYRPVRELAGWSWSHFEQGQRLLGEARQRQSELKDTLDALAYANQQLALANQRLAAMRAVAEGAERSKAAFVANVSHEFRTPLNIIIGLAELLMDAPQIYRTELPAAIRRDVEVIHRNSEHLASLINDVLDLSQVEAGEMALHHEWIDLGALLHSAVAIVEPLINEKHLALHLAVPLDLPVVWCDPRRIRQVVLNLVSNAARFTDAGGITVVAESRGGAMRVSIRDTGPGLTAADLTRIFEPFNQGSPLSPAQARGSGLGLSISRQFIEMHHGTIAVQSTPGVGSEFSFTLPIAPTPEPRAPAERWITDGWAARRTRASVIAPELQRRLMVLDTVGGLEPVLTRYAHDLTLVPARDLSDARDRMATEAAQGLLVNVPSVAKLWPMVHAAANALPDTPIVACVLPSANARATAAGARGHLLKPLGQEMLAATLASIGSVLRRVLVVDDEPDALDVMVRLLVRCDNQIEVLRAGSGSETLAAMMSERPDLVLLDIVLPDMDGWEVLRLAQADERLREVPVVLVSAQDPRDEPLTSPLIAGGIARGLSLTKLLRCSQALATLMMQPD